MAIDFSLVNEPTWAEIIACGKYALARGCYGINVGTNGRNISFVNADDAIKRIKFAQQMIADESTDASGGIALVQFGEAV